MDTKTKVFLVAYLINLGMLLIPAVQNSHKAFMLFVILAIVATTLAVESVVKYVKKG